MSALILTYNEADNLPRCLESLRWCDDILVLDSGSTDSTVTIAQSCGARVLERRFDTFAEQRNFGLDAGDLQHEWVLHLDADEVVTPELQVAIRELQPRESVWAYRLPSKLMLFDRWLRHAGMYPTYQVRLGHRDRLRFKQVGHGQQEDLSPDEVGTLHEPYLHYNFSHGLASWFAKHVRYARDEAEQIAARRDQRLNVRIRDLWGNSTQRRRFLKMCVGGLPLVLRPLARFVYVVVLRQGLRDGRSGIIYALMLSVYEGMIAAFVFERLASERVKKTAEVRDSVMSIKKLDERSETNDVVWSKDSRAARA